MTIVVGVVVTLICILGGFAALGGYMFVLWQPFEYLIICGSALGTFVVANPMKIIKDTGKGLHEAFQYQVPTQRDHLELLGLLYGLMRELRTKPRTEVEAHIEKPDTSSIFQNFPSVMANDDLVTFICDYFRLNIIGKARPHEIEALMDEEIQTFRSDKLKCYHALVTVAEALPALGIVTAVLGVINAMGSLKEPPDILGGMIGSALVGTFLGILISYTVFSPIAAKIKTIQEQKVRLYVVVKQTFLAFMNGALPQVALEHGRKVISAYERPTIDQVEEKTLGLGQASSAGN